MKKIISSVAILAGMLSIGNLAVADPNNDEEGALSICQGIADGAPWALNKYNAMGGSMKAQWQLLCSQLGVDIGK